MQEHNQESKVHICLFTCATSRAIHLEVVNDLTVDIFLLSFRRFVSRRSLPSIMVSNNASTYQSTAEELLNSSDPRSSQTTSVNKEY